MLDKKINFLNYKSSLEHSISADYLIHELQFAPSRVYDSGLDRLAMGGCPSCPSCACIEADLQFLAVIEAPGTVPILVLLGATSFASH